jgi:hypothetical protein
VSFSYHELNKTRAKLGLHGFDPIGPDTFSRLGL